jgi:tRNA/rRNA methyltransferase
MTARTPAPAPVTILVEPQLGENIGAAARAMLNFGLTEMRVVSPRDGWPNPRAVAMASGAGRVLDGARAYASTAEAVADLHFVYATTARPREIAKTVMTPERAMAHARELTAGGSRVGILFGRERTGLETADVVRANAIVTVPVNPEFPSLNLAQCVLLMAYEWHRQGDLTPAAVNATGRSRPAEAGEVARMLDHLVTELDAARFFWPEAKRASMEANLRNLFHRAPLTDQDVRTLWGVTRALAEGPKRRRAGAAAALPAPEDCTDMAVLRAAIDRLDRRLIGLFAEREGYIRRAAELKATAGLPAHIPERVEEVVANIRAAAAAEGLDPAFYETLWRVVIEAAIALEQARLGR